MHWANAPIRELAIGVQFEPLPGFSNAYSGAFWNLVRAEYPFVRDVMPRDLTFESFGQPLNYGVPTIPVAETTLETRLQMLAADRSRMMQLQNGWLVVNWVRTDEPAARYPGFSELSRKLVGLTDRFNKFVSEHSIGTLRPTAIELTYIDQISEGTVWNTFSELPQVFPGVLSPVQTPDCELEGVAGRWAFSFGQSGRVSFVIQSAVQPHPTKPKNIVLATTTARSPLTDLADFVAVLRVAKSRACEVFERVTSETAKQYWRGNG